MKKLLMILMLSFGFSQTTTLTKEQADNLAKNIQELQIKADSLSTSDSLKTIELNLLNEKIDSLEEDLDLTEKKAKLVKPSWYENKRLYFTYGAILGAGITDILNSIKNIVL